MIPTPRIETPEHAAGTAHRSPGWWRMALLVTTLPLVLTLGYEMWVLPYPISETVGVLRDVGITADGGGARISEPSEPSKLATFFDPTRRSWYRPLYWATWYAMWRGTDSLETSLLLFRLLEVANTVLLVWLFISLLRPAGFLDYAAATVATAVLVGTPAFRDNLELPLPITLLGMLFALLVWAILERDRRWWHGPAIVALTVLAVGFKEQGLVMVPVIVGAWMARAPGVRIGTAGVTTAITLVYLGVRLSTSGSWRPFEQDVGFGFTMLAAGDAAERFGTAPLWIYAYNVVSTLGSILFSEPSSGVFQITRDILAGRPAPWQLNQLATSATMTALIGWWCVRVFTRAWRAHAWSAESRLAAVTLLAVLASGALGFNYSRDRLGGMAMVFYALAAYHALRTAADQARRSSHRTWLATSLALMLLSTGWQLRAAGTVDSLQVLGRHTRREWICNLQQTRIRHPGEDNYLGLLSALAPQGQQRTRTRSEAYEHWADAALLPR